VEVVALEAALELGTYLAVAEAEAGLALTLLII